MVNMLACTTRWRTRKQVAVIVGWHQDKGIPATCNACGWGAGNDVMPWVVAVLVVESGGR